MIEQTSFLGMPLRTCRQRRTLVVLYYLLVLAFVGLALWHWRGSTAGVLFMQTLTIGGVLGGIRVGGPVKLYEENNIAEPSGLTALNLEGRRPFATWFGSAWSPLDERERERRNFAHYTAYRILRWTLCPALILYGFTLDVNSAWLFTRSPALAWFVLIYILSLPQCVLLWTEPDQPGELAAISTAC